MARTLAIILVSIVSIVIALLYTLSTTLSAGRTNLSIRELKIILFLLVPFLILLSIVIFALDITIYLESNNLLELG